MASYVYFHRFCQDGVASIWVLSHNVHTDILYEPSTAGSAVRLYKYRQDSTIYFVDICPPLKQLAEIAEMKEIKKIVVIDHHEIGRISDLEKQYKHLTVLHDQKHSACVLTHKFFNPKAKVPKLLLYIEDRDLWKFSLENSKIINEAIYASLKDAVALYNNRDYKKTFSAFDQQSMRLEQNPNAFIDEGNIRLQMTSLIVDMLAQGAQQAMIRIQNTNYNVWHINTRLYKSEVGNLLLEKPFRDGSLCAFVLCWNYDVKTKKFWLSFRGNDKTENVGDIARRFAGGGGHRNSAGARITVKEFQDLFV